MKKHRQLHIKKRPHFSFSLASQPFPYNFHLDQASGKSYYSNHATTTRSVCESSLFPSSLLQCISLQRSNLGPCPLQDKTHTIMGGHCVQVLSQWPYFYCRHLRTRASSKSDCASGELNMGSNRSGERQRGTRISHQTVVRRWNPQKGRSTESWCGS